MSFQIAVILVIGLNCPEGAIITETAGVNTEDVALGRHRNTPLSSLYFMKMNVLTVQVVVAECMCACVCVCVCVCVCWGGTCCLSLAEITANLIDLSTTVPPLTFRCNEEICPESRCR